MEFENKWVQWAVELQSLAQAGLTYGKDAFDLQRYQRIRDISAQMMSHMTEIPLDRVKDLFCGDRGYQTPKLDTRAAIFEDGKILLVQERDGRWSLPGGWVDMDISVGENVVKEVREEAGLTVTAEKVIAIQDRAKHNLPVYAYGVCKVFVQCAAVGGAFDENLETTGSGYFSLEELPELADEKNTKEQIALCFQAYHAENWNTLLD